ncbi:uncharacterized protein DUF664 [Motilibacter rhizosphaerae]|uniref:Uncharacterized protein DUF664 n=1 Tax=Motilibacter rhizosphaerae TaxID=598652 RepID=A0A4V2F4K2_9ACTN|nr:DUF664 domain-containing protein [Motilibacter rhizosphaerae]RZS89609.1 uncharacterized protein DUF664 [Motilibacter rhizosphaerae]
MTAADLLTDALVRIRELGAAAVDGLDDAALRFQPEGRGNTIAWLVWHAARVQDDHVADAAAVLDDASPGQVWVEQGFADRFGLPLDQEDTGYGHAPEQVREVRASAALLRDYLDAVVTRSEEVVRGLTDADLERVVDERWDPPVTLSVRLVSVLSDDLQHLGQAAYVRGLLPTS